MTNSREIIVTLNSLGVGDLQSIRAKLESARSDIVAQGHQEIGACLQEASAALGRGELTEFRRLVSQAVSRLGHLRE